MFYATEQIVQFWKLATLLSEREDPTKRKRCLENKGMVCTRPTGCGTTCTTPVPSQQR